MKAPPFYFAVKHLDTQKSSCIRLWAQNNSEVYFSVRNYTSLIKVSLHKSGYWKIQSIKENSSMDLLFHWRKPEYNIDGYINAFVFFVPNLFMDFFGMYRDNPDNIFFINSKEVGNVVIIHVLFVKANKVESVKNKLLNFTFIHEVKINDHEVLLVAYEDRKMIQTECIDTISKIKKLKINYKEKPIKDNFYSEMVFFEVPKKVDNNHIPRILQIQVDHTSQYKE